MSNKYIVFSDVDETLIRFKSMITFMDYFLYKTPYAATPGAEEKRTEFQAINEANTPTADRVALNRRFYAMFAGISQAELRERARTWMKDILARGELFVRSAYSEQQEHRKRGAELVLVSGSFEDILNPICEHVGADRLICSELEVKDGVYTGKLLQQVIGDGKWDAISRYIDGRGITLASCFAYGDHVSDLCFMEKVGNPVVVGDSPGMLEVARKRQWRVLTEEEP
ncbi:HAD-IB family hydrolase [Stigmatella sp. ncwal1]|uniref:HAD-IB family hydrolase n=1 Tax=Stigmatella ashevillensis TaxID=2995309 RepID=A0ABT5D6Z1_9BACT|nr:HAD-IB family hydrolase [Stigmatella ashevillena]MDC0708031.1 HAD-IB family hydrolase [Stigmatella ashevillena]